MENDLTEEEDNFVRHFLRPISERFQSEPETRKLMTEVLREGPVFEESLEGFLERTIDEMYETFVDHLENATSTLPKKLSERSAMRELMRKQSEKYKKILRPRKKL